MKENPSTTINRLERQNKEWKEKYMETLRENRSLRAKLRIQSVDLSTIIQYKEFISNLTKTNNDLRKNLDELKSQNKQLKSETIRANKEVERVWGFYKELQNEVEEGKCPKRVEDFKKGKYEDRWGLPFFDDNLIFNVNPLNGKTININLQLKLDCYLNEHYCDLMTVKRRFLEDYKLQKDNDEMNVKTYMEKKHLLGMDIWNMVNGDINFLEILSDW